MVEISRLGSHWSRASWCFFIVLLLYGIKIGGFSDLISDHCSAPLCCCLNHGQYRTGDSCYSHSSDIYTIYHCRYETPYLGRNTLLFILLLSKIKRKTAYLYVRLSLAPLIGCIAHFLMQPSVMSIIE